MNEFQFLAQQFNIESLNSIEELEQHIAHLIVNDFEKLTWILYRIDVDEELLKQEIAKHQEPEAKTITRLLLARCQQIIETRKKYSSDENHFYFDDDNQ